MAPARSAHLTPSESAAAKALRRARREVPAIPFQKPARKQAPDTRGFGVEIEYDVSNGFFRGPKPYRILPQLRKEGLLRGDRPGDKFDPSTQWHFDREDMLLGGELVSHVLHDDKRS